MRDFKTNLPTSVVGLPSKVYGLPLRRDIVWSCMIWQRNLERQGTHSTKGRGEVKGSSRKMRPQKKTGRARAGSKRVGHWRGGGVIHGPKPRLHATRLNLKVRELGLKVVLSEKLRQNELKFVDSYTPLNQSELVQHIQLHYPPTTKQAVLTAFGEKYSNCSKILFLSGDNEDFISSITQLNMPGIKAYKPNAINFLDMLQFHTILFDSSAKDMLTKRLLREK